MKRYYAVDIEACYNMGITLLEWTILENIHFLSSDTGWCYATKKSLADHHKITGEGFRKIRIDLVKKGYLKTNQKGDLKTTKKWIEKHTQQSCDDIPQQSCDTQQSCTNSVGVNAQQSCDDIPNSVAHLPIKEESLSVAFKCREENAEKKVFTFALKKDTQYQDLSERYKHNLKAKCLLIDGDINRYENFIISLEAKGYKYKDFPKAYMSWDKERNYQSFVPDPEPKLGSEWVKIKISDEKVIAINKDTFEMREGISKVTQQQDEDQFRMAAPISNNTNRAFAMTKNLAKEM